MKISEPVWKDLASLLKAKLLAKYDPSVLSPDGSSIKSKLDIDHCGFYMTVYDSKNERIARSGFLQQRNKNVFESALKVVEALHAELESKSVQNKRLLTSSYNFVAVWDVVFIENSLAWDVNKDGIYVSWGDRYKGLYLPQEITQMNVTKAEILNRLCSWELGIPSNLWRLPEGMTYKILCDSYSI